MPISAVHVCQCGHCQGPGEHPDKEIHRQMNLLGKPVGRATAALVCGGGSEPAGSWGSALAVADLWNRREDD